MKSEIAFVEIVLKLFHSLTIYNQQFTRRIKQVRESR
jgi:hypothetical protein